METQNSQQLQALNKKTQLQSNVQKQNNQWTENGLNSLLKMFVVIFFASMLYIMMERIYLLADRNEEMQQLLQIYESAIKNLRTKLKNFDSNSDNYSHQDQQKLQQLSLQIKQLQHLIQGKTQFDSASFQPGLLQEIQNIEQQTLQRDTVINLLFAHSKQYIRQKKIAMMQKIGQKKQFQQQKIRNPWALNKINLKTPYIDTLQRRHMQEQLQKESERLQAQYKLSLFPNQLPLCVIVPTHNNAKNYRYEYNLQSIINQDYSNYKVVIIDDASEDGTGDLIQTFIRRSRQPSHRFVFIRNTKRLSAVPNINMAIRKHCGADDIALLVSGDDQLLGKKVFKLINAVYQAKKPGMAYTNHFFGKLHQNDFQKGYSRSYSIPEIKNKNYRFIGQNFGHMRTFSVRLFLQIKEQHMKYRDGTWIQATYDQTFVLPILEMACDSIEYIDEFVYLYNYGTGQNDGQIRHEAQSQAAIYVRQLPRYDCVQKYRKYKV